MEEEKNGKRKQLQQNRFKGDSSKSNKFLQPARTLEEWLSIEQESQGVENEEEDLGWNLVRIVIPPYPMTNRLLKQEQTFVLWQKKERYVIMIFDDLDILQHEYDCLFIWFWETHVKMQRLQEDYYFSQSWTWKC